MEDEVLIAGATVYKTRGKKYSWLLIKNPSDGEWQLPKGVVRRAESSVRATIRMLSEMTGLRARVLEEVGRTTSTTAKNKRSATRRTIYYLMQQRGKDSEISPSKTLWADLARARTKLKTATERRMLSQARSVLLVWQKDTQNLQ